MPCWGGGCLLHKASFPQIQEERPEAQGPMTSHTFIEHLYDPGMGSSKMRLTAWHLGREPACQGYSPAQWL